MKVLIVLCLTAMALAESDPYLYANNGAWGGYGAVGYGGGYGSLLGYSAYSGHGAPAHTVVTHSAGWPYATAGYAHGIYKREAEAEAEPLYYGSNLGYAGHGYGYAGALGYGAGYAGALGYAAPHYGYSAGGINAYGATVQQHRGLGGYAAAGRYVANSGGALHIAKREAEAEAKPYLYGAGLGYASGYASPYLGGYSAGYASPYSYGRTYSTYAARPFAYSGAYGYAGW